MCVCVSMCVGHTHRLHVYSNSWRSGGYPWALTIHQQMLSLATNQLKLIIEPKLWRTAVCESERARERERHTEKERNSSYILYSVECVCWAAAMEFWSEIHSILFQEHCFFISCSIFPQKPVLLFSPFPAPGQISFVPAQSGLSALRSAAAAAAALQSRMNVAKEHEKKLMNVGSTFSGQMTPA